MQISERAYTVSQSNSILFNRMVQTIREAGHKVVNLSIGDTAFTMPTFTLSETDFNHGYHYSDSQGLSALREKIASVYRTLYHVPVDPATELLITAGSKAAIYLAMLATLNPGDEVLLPEPAWLSYVEQIKLVGAIPRFIPYDCTVAQYAGYVTDKTRMVVINNPNNPSGRLYSRAELETLYGICHTRKIYVLADEAYSDFVENESFCALGSLVDSLDGLITVNSLSKNLGVSGWRIGYIIASQELIFNIYKLNQHLITCAPTVLQIYLARHYDEMHSIAMPQAQEIARKRDHIQKEISRIGLHCLPGSATFYFFVHIGEYAYSSTDMAMYLLLRYRIAVVPGSSYGKSTERFIRISIGTESDESILKAMQTIKRVIDENEYDGEFVDKQLLELGFAAFQQHQ